jgi:hypothetical protein
VKRQTIIATSNSIPRRGAVLIFAMMAMLVALTADLAALKNEKVKKK